jgi:MoaA/NifB/PqqE/SkfB family radical SAM enzyme
MSLHNFDTVLERLASHPIKEAKLMGMGEPYLHPQFSTITRRFKERFPHARLISATNAQYTMTDDFRASLEWIDMLYISIDGYKDNYERDRPPAKWSKLIAFLEQLRSVNRHNCTLAINTTVNPRNVDDVPLLEGLRQQYGLDELRLNVAQDWSPTGTAPTEYTSQQIRYLHDHWQHLIKGKSEWSYSDCFWPQRGVYITVEGRVLTCCMNTQADHHGNILATSIDTIRASKSFQDIVRGCATDTPTSHCRTCSYNQLKPVLAQLGV